MSDFIVVNGTQSMRKLLREIQLRDYKSSLILNKFLSLSRIWKDAGVAELARLESV